jgi:hypothetical protein
MEAEPALVGPADAVVLGAVAGEGLDGAVVALDGHSHLVDGLGLLEPFDDVRVDVDEAGRAAELAAGHGVGRVRFGRRVRLRRNGRGGVR